MKTTIEIADPVLNEARKLAAKEGTTLRALVERGLRQVVAEGRRKKPFRLRRVTSGGEGLSPDLQEGGWEKIRDLIYEGRGG